MADFKKLSEVPEVETAAEGAKVILEQNGEIVRGPAPKSAGGSVIISLKQKQGTDASSGTIKCVAYLGQSVIESALPEIPKDINGNNLPIITGKEILELCQNGSTIYVQPLDIIYDPPQSISQFIGKIVHFYDLATLIVDLLLSGENPTNGAHLSCGTGDYEIANE